LCDLELLMVGAFSPLEGFLGRADYESVLRDLRLTDGTVWPMPIMLDVSRELGNQLIRGGHLALRDEEGNMRAALEVDSVWEYDPVQEAEAVFGTSDRDHPGVASLFAQQPVYVGGRVLGVEGIPHYDFKTLRRTPAELRAEFAAAGWRRVTAFQTRNPMHRAHRELTIRAAEQVNSNLLIHPVVGITKPGDINYYVRVRCYQAIAKQYPPRTMKLALLNLAMRMGGPREALWHAIIRRNHGCSHFIVGRDHAGPGNDARGTPFYGPYEAQDLLRHYEEEIGVRMVPFQEMLYVPALGSYFPADSVGPGVEVQSISGTEFRRRLREGLEIPEWFSYPEVLAELRRSHPPKHKQGFTLFFTGLSGAGKSTLAKIIMPMPLTQPDAISQSKWGCL
jgi:sulfate adenylyltransferase